VPHLDYLNDVLILLVAAIFVVTLMRRLRVSPILGFLLSGLLIGPHGFSFIDGVEETKVLAEFGVVFLLFTIGLELPWDRLMSLKRYVFGLGTSQVILTGVIMALISSFTGLSLEVSLLIGCGLSLSSTAVVLQVLAERGELAARFGRVSFSVLLLQDLAVVVFLVLTPLLAQDQITTHSGLLTTLGIATVKALAVLTAIVLVGRLLLRPLYRLVASGSNAELFVAMSLLLILGTGVATETVGLSKELGAFLAGLLLAETEYRHQVEADIQPFRGILLGLFFMTVGMNIDLRLLGEFLGTVSAIVGSMLVGKCLILTLLCRLFSVPWGPAIRIGLLLSTGGEFAFVLFGPAITTGILTNEVGQILLLSVAISMAFTPFLAAIGKKINRRLERSAAENLVQFAQKETADLQSHVIIVGYGRVGQMVGKLLTAQLVPYVAIDINMSRVSEGRTEGLPIFFGDARRAEIFKTIGIERAQAAVITLDQPGAVSRTVMMMRRNFKDLPLFVRAQDVEQAKKLEKAGAKVIIPETLEPSFQLSASVLEAAGISTDQITKSIDALRKKILATEEEEKIDQDNEVKKPETAISPPPSTKLGKT
jgi:monovalent cation:H+ antiporter-2, CPA2 family